MREKGKSEDAIATELARRSANSSSSGASALRPRAFPGAARGARRPRSRGGGERAH